MLLQTKLFIPPQRPNLVFRQRLMAKLEDALFRQYRLVLVSAKAGSGKTTLVSEWVQQQERPAAWLSLDANDNDPRRFFRYLIAALSKIGVKVNRSLLGQLETPQLPQLDTLMAGLINDIAANPFSFLLVFDDYHLIQNEWIHQAIGILAKHQPPEVQLILITRTDPPLPLAQLRGKSQITEIRDGDLRFTAEEAGQFLNEVMNLDLPTEAISALEERTEGWIVGLQMAAISMQSRNRDEDLSLFIDAFSGSNRFILDYLLEEVLSQQSPAIQDFLLDTSILERMCSKLCDAVQFEGATPRGIGTDSEVGSLVSISSGLSEREIRRGLVPRQDSQAILAQLERTNLFVVSLDNERRWYRYHHLFADLLNSTLGQRKSAEEIRELHRRASRWHQGEGYLEEAMTHALAAQDFERAASMIDENFVSMFSRSEVPLLLGWIEKLPEEIVRGRPWVDIYQAYMLALSGQPDEAEPLLDGVEKRIDPDAPRFAELLGHIAAIRSYIANLQGDAARVFEMADLAERYLQNEHRIAQGMVAYALADTHFASDDIGNANMALLNMLKSGEKIGRLMIIIPALCDLAATKKVQGRLHQAETFYSRAHDWMAKRDGLESRLRCFYEFGLADLFREWNQLDAAYEHTMIGVEYRRRLGGYMVVGDLAVRRVLQARGDVDGALEALYKAEQAMQTYEFQMAISIEFKTARVAQWLAVGDVRAASRYAGECNGGSEPEQIVLAKLRLAQGRAADAQRLLERQRLLAEAGGRNGRLIEILSLQALALETQDRLDEACSTLSQALSLARPEGYMRLFLDLGRPLGELLERMLALQAKDTIDASNTRVAPWGYERDLLEAFQQERKARRQAEETDSLPESMAESLISPLTERELDVLRLLAEGISNKEIADRLVVAPSTVKQHLKNIYGKLEVHSRIQAVERGRELELL